MFDATQPFIVEISSGGIRRCELNYPSDQDWKQRAQRQRILQQNLGRGKSTSSLTPIEDWDLELFTKLLRSKPEVEFDLFEASMVLDRLAAADVVKSEVTNDSIMVRLAVFGVATGPTPGADFDELFAGRRTVTLTLKAPRRKDVIEYGREAVKTVNTRNASETRVSIEPAERLFDRLLLSSSGYAENSPIPIVHKDAAIVELIRLQNPEA